MTAHSGLPERWPTIFPWIAFPFYFGSTNHGKTRSPAIQVNDSTLRLALMLAQFNLFFLFYLSVDSTSILLFFRSMESHGKTRSVFTPPLCLLYIVLALFASIKD